MKNNILPAIRLTLASIVVFGVIFPLTVWAIAQLAPNNGKGEVVEYEGKTYYSNIGQSFTADNYFQSRPSAVNYDTAGSGASNKGASNTEYLETVETRINTFLAQNPTVKREDVPVDLVTASGSGLDPNISVKSAIVQLNRIAQFRGISEESLQKLIEKETEKPLFGLFGTEKINVLKLNIALDKMK